MGPTRGRLSLAKIENVRFVTKPSTLARKRPVVPVEYPYSDGIALAESPRHMAAINHAFVVLQHWFTRAARVHVGSCENLFYAEGDPEKKLVPDLFVVRGLAELPEPSYRVWEVGKAPDFVLEVASPSNERRDVGEKQALYAAMGVGEYWRFNPIGALMWPRQEGARLEGGRLSRLAYEPLSAGVDGSIYSETLGLELRVGDRRGQEHLLRFRDPQTGKDLLTFEESERGRLEERSRRLEAERALSAEIVARRDSEAEIARLKAQIEELESGVAEGRTKERE